MLEIIKSWLTSTAGLTISAVIALFIFSTKIILDYLAEKQRQKHLRNALIAYIDYILFEAQATQKNFDVGEAIKKIEANAAYTPYVLYDSGTGFNIQTICREYSFLETGAIQAVVGYIISVDYLRDICEQLRTEYVRSFTSKRKIQLVNELSETLNEVVVKSRKARDALLQ